MKKFKSEQKIDVFLSHVYFFCGGKSKNITKITPLNGILTKMVQEFIFVFWICVKNVKKIISQKLRNNHRIHDNKRMASMLISNLNLYTFCIRKVGKKKKSKKFKTRSEIDYREKNLVCPKIEKKKILIRTAEERDGGRRVAKIWVFSGELSVGCKEVPKFHYQLV